jgi:hypothetical protein
MRRGWTRPWGGLVPEPERLTREVLSSRHAPIHTISECQGDQHRPFNRPPDADLTSLCAGQSLCGAPRGNRTGDPILTMNHQEPLCGTPLPQVTPDRVGRSYRFSFDEVMRSRTSHVPIAAGASHHLQAKSPTRERPRIPLERTLSALARNAHSQVSGSTMTAASASRPLTASG